MRRLYVPTTMANYGIHEENQNVKAHDYHVDHLKVKAHEQHVGHLKVPKICAHLCW
jgi:hypothetical protein